MHTAINDPAILVVFELVAKPSDEDAEDGGGIASDVGCGWGFISLFKRNVRSVDVCDSAASPASRYIALDCVCLFCITFIFCKTCSVLVY